MTDCGSDVLMQDEDFTKPKPKRPSNKWHFELWVETGHKFRCGTCGHSEELKTLPTKLVSHCPLPTKELAEEAGLHSEAKAKDFGWRVTYIRSVPE